MHPMRSRRLSSPQGKDFALRLALMRLCTRGTVFGAYLVTNARQANVPLMSAITQLTASAGPRTFITSTLNNSWFAVTPSSVSVVFDTLHAEARLIRGFCSGQQRRHVGRE